MSSPLPFPDRSDITGLILAGGQGRRMGGQDKGLVLWEQLPLVLHARKRLAPQVNSVLISANRHLDEYAALTGDRVLTDVMPGYLGPLSGLHAGLSACTTTYLAVVPCDSPDFPLDLVARMAETLSNHPQIVITWVKTPSGDHPVFALARKTLLHRLEQALNKGQRRVRDFFQETGGEPTLFDQEAPFRNLNEMGSPPPRR